MSTAVLRTEQLTADDLSGLRALWRAAFTDGFSAEDEEHALGGWHAIVRSDDGIVAHASVVARTLFVDGVAFATGYVEGVAVAPSRQGSGLGSAVMEALHPVIQEAFELGFLSTGRRTFYERLGWEAWAGPSYVLRGGVEVRTPDEDEGLMALRFGPSLEVPLTARVVCEDRSGDCW